MKRQVAETEKLYASRTARKVWLIFILLAAVVALALAVTPLGAASLGIGDVLHAIGAHPGNMRSLLDGMTDSNLVLENGFGIIR